MKLSFVSNNSTVICCLQSFILRWYFHYDLFSEAVINTKKGVGFLIMNWRGCGRKGSWPDLYYSLAGYVLRADRRPQKSWSLGVPAGILTGCLRITSPKRYHSSQRELFVYSCNKGWYEILYEEDVWKCTRREVIQLGCFWTYVLNRTECCVNCF